ncbi:MAG TPA: hypothetical protein VIE16_12235 [Phenylobacterium sp.]|jgi:hypothetical protein
MARKTAPRGAALDKGLEAMFRALQQRPTPDHIRSVVDQLDAGDGDAAQRPVRKTG